MIPACDQTGTPHFHSSTTSGSACLMILRNRARVLPRQSSRLSILASIIFAADWEASPFGAGFTFFVVVFALAILVPFVIPRCCRRSDAASLRTTRRRAARERTRRDPRGA